MNRSQLASVALGVVIFLAGALLALRTLAGAPGAAGSAPSLMSAQAPVATLLMAAAVTALGVTVALLGVYLTGEEADGYGDRRRRRARSRRSSTRSRPHSNSRPSSQPG